MAGFLCPLVLRRCQSDVLRIGRSTLFAEARRCLLLRQLPEALVAPNNPATGTRSLPGFRCLAAVFTAAAVILKHGLGVLHGCESAASVRRPCARRLRKPHQGRTTQRLFNGTCSLRNRHVQQCRCLKSRHADCAGAAEASGDQRRFGRGPGKGRANKAAEY